MAMMAKLCGQLLQVYSSFQFLVASNWLLVLATVFIGEHVVITSNLVSEDCFHKWKE